MLAHDGTRPMLDDEGRPRTRWDGLTRKPHPITGEDVPDPAATVPVLEYLGPRRAPRPEAEFVIGNPPFIGGKDMRAELGDGYAEAAWKARPEIPGGADFGMHFWDEAARRLTANGTRERRTRCGPSAGERLVPHPHLTMTGLYNVLERLRELEAGAPVEPLTDAERDVHAVGRIGVLKDLHDRIDRAVFEAYGWGDLGAALVGRPGGITPSSHKSPQQEDAEEELMVRLVALNNARAAEEAGGEIGWLRPEFQIPRLRGRAPMPKEASISRPTSPRWPPAPWRSLPGLATASTRSGRSAQPSPRPRRPSPPRNSTPASRAAATAACACRSSCPTWPRLA